jgi:nicotinamidase-related amidase
MAAFGQHKEAASYLQSGFGNKLGWGSRPALIVIDVCRAYWSKDSPLDLLHNPEGAAAPDSMRRLVAAARTGNVPVIWVQVRYNKGKMIDGRVQYMKSKGGTFWQDGDTRGMDAWLLGLEPEPRDTVIFKKNPSAFFGTTLSTELQLMNVDTLVLCGVSTSGCVRATTLDAMCYGFRPMVSYRFPVQMQRKLNFNTIQVVESACGDRSAIIQSATLFDLHSKYADVVTEEAIEKMKAGWV